MIKPRPVKHVMLYSRHVVIAAQVPDDGREECWGVEGNQLTACGWILKKKCTDFQPGIQNMQKKKKKIQPKLKLFRPSVSNTASPRSTCLRSWEASTSIGYIKEKTLEDVRRCNRFRCFWLFFVSTFFLLDVSGWFSGWFWLLLKTRWVNGLGHMIWEMKWLSHKKDG